MRDEVEISTAEVQSARRKEFSIARQSDLRDFCTTIVEKFRALRKLSGDRRYRKQGNVSRQVREVRKGHLAPAPKEI